MLGYNYVSGIWQADGLRIASILESGGKMVFHYQWLEGQEAYLVNLTMCVKMLLGKGTSSILESGGKMVFHYQWLEGQEALPRQSHNVCGEAVEGGCERHASSLRARGVGRTAK
jgi:hypothetical protein